MGEVLYEKLTELLIIASEIRPRHGKLLNLILLLIGDTHAPDELFVKALGDLYPGWQSLNLLQNQMDHNITQSYYDNGKITSFDEKVDYTESVKLLGDHILCLEREDTIVNAKILLLEHVIDKKRSVLIDRIKSNPNLIEDIETKAKDIHNTALINETTVYHLYNDGEFTMQKGGEIYLSRSEFNLNTPMVLAPFTFPIKCANEYSYAIVSQEDGEVLRAKMKLLTIY